jgi:glycosyltransferase involved in cell wall biosynthesis
VEAVRIVSDQPSVVYAMPDAMGGALTIVANLLQYRSPDAFAYRAVLTYNRMSADTRSSRRLAAETAIVEYALPLENMYAVARRIGRAVGPGPGVLVCNDFAEMLFVSLCDPGRTIVQILHGDYDYYYKLAADHEPLVHAFVAYSRTVYEKLIERIPHRRDTIFWLPYGIPISGAGRRASAGPLRLLFLGRLDEAKGIFDLPIIDRHLKDAGVPVTWTIVGSGPSGAELAARWTGADHVSWIPSATPDEVRDICGRHDVFVLPSRAEGLSVATVEAMSAGLVPLVTDLPSMVELVDGTLTGVRLPVGAPAAFARAIAALAGDRNRLETMGAAARRVAVERFDVRERTAAYSALYARWRELYRPRPARTLRTFGSRLDQPWIPNSLVYALRRGERWLHQA